MQSRCFCSSVRSRAEVFSLCFQFVPEQNGLEAFFDDALQFASLARVCGCASPKATFSKTDRGKGLGRWKTMPDFPAQQVDFRVVLQS